MRSFGQPSEEISDVRTATRLSGIELSDWEGKRVRLGTLWEKQPVVLVFIRHFG